MASVPYSQGIKNSIYVEDLKDVSLTNLQNNQLLKYDGTNWVNGTVSGGPGGVSELNDLNDVDTTTTTPVQGHVLIRDATNFKNRALNEGDITNLLSNLASKYDSSTLNIPQSQIQDLVSNLASKYDSTTVNIPQSQIQDLVSNLARKYDSSTLNIPQSQIQNFNSNILIGSGTVGNPTGSNVIAIGVECANNQADYGLAIGYRAGREDQQYAGIALGGGAGEYTQGQFAVALGTHSGRNNQGNHSVAIGYKAGETTQHNNTIVINGTQNQPITTTQQESSCYIHPIRSIAPTDTSNILFYNTDKEIISSTSIPQNKITNLTNTLNTLTNTLTNKQDTLNFDPQPIDDSVANVLSSNVLYHALGGKQDTITSTTDLTLQDLTANQFISTLDTDGTSSFTKILLKNNTNEVLKINAYGSNHAYAFLANAVEMYNENGVLFIGSAPNQTIIVSNEFFTRCLIVQNGLKWSDPDISISYTLPTIIVDCSYKSYIPLRNETFNNDDTIINIEFLNITDGAQIVLALGTNSSTSTATLNHPLNILVDGGFVVSDFIHTNINSALTFQKDTNDILITITYLGGHFYITGQQI